MKRELTLTTLAKHGDDAVQFLWGGNWIGPVYSFLHPGNYQESDWRLNPAFFQGKGLSFNEAEQLFEQGDKVQMLMPGNDGWINVNGDCFTSGDAYWKTCDYRLAPVEPAKPEPSPVDYTAEKLIADCIPGGSICDPQEVADKVREWFKPKGQGMPEPKRQPLRPEDLIGAMLVSPSGRTFSINWMDDEYVHVTGGCGITTFQRLKDEGWRYVRYGEEPKSCWRTE